MHGVLQVAWRVSPLGLPRVWRHCDRCKQWRFFACSGKFRSNIHKKRIDIWLIYRCTRCEATWNFPIYERRSIAEIDPGLFQAYAENHIEAVRRHAFDLVNLRRHAGRVEPAAAITVDKRIEDGQWRTAELLLVTIALTASCAVRLERLLASELALSRGQLRSLYDRKILELSPAGRRRLKQAVCDGQKIVLHLGDGIPRRGTILDAACGKAAEKR